MNENWKTPKHLPVSSGGKVEGEREKNLPGENQEGKKEIGCEGN